MAYGDYSGPDKPNKGKEGGACNRTLCQAEPARWFNHGSYAWYCDDCARDIGKDAFNEADWLRNFQPSLGHPQFETREMIDARQTDEAVMQHARDTGDISPLVARMEKYMGYVERDGVPAKSHEDARFIQRQRQAPRPKDQYKTRRGWKSK